MTGEVMLWFLSSLERLHPGTTQTPSQPHPCSTALLWGDAAALVQWLLLREGFSACVLRDAGFHPHVPSELGWNSLLLP